MFKIFPKMGLLEESQNNDILTNISEVKLKYFLPEVWLLMWTIASEKKKLMVQQSNHVKSFLSQLSDKNSFLL